jgi:glycosyltransferase involved in cell wall biosynthesis/GT2 family glycosyltransferase
VSHAVVPAVSVVINTYNRAASLATTLDSLALLDYPRFEVVVVNGPSTDETESLLTRWSGQIKILTVAERNLSLSRNVGIAAAACGIVAFLDDDAYPDPCWLDCIVAAYDCHDVAGAGGPVYDHTGYSLQAHYNLTDRFGTSWPVGPEQPNPTEVLCNPCTNVFPSSIGTNSSFRRDRLIAIGGFDEEYDYYLDETDVCIRLIDSGYVIRALDKGHVYHKSLPSHWRTPNRVLRDRYSVIKNRMYFAGKHAAATQSWEAIMENMRAFIDRHRRDYEWCVQQGYLTRADLRAFRKAIPHAVSEALTSLRSGVERTRSPAWFDAGQQPFVDFRSGRRALTRKRLHVCLYSQQFPPGHVGGIARFTYELARGLAERGHHVHVLTRGGQCTTVNLEKDAWVHRVHIDSFKRPANPEVPQELWNYSSSLYRETLRIHAHRAVDVISAPLWDSEGIAAILGGVVPVSVSLHTPLHAALSIAPHIANNPVYYERWIRPLLSLEQICLDRCCAVLANSEAVLAEVESCYKIRINRDFCRVVPHGIGECLPPDTNVHGRLVRMKTANHVEILFVGRLERRKGIDVFLKVVPALLERFADLRVKIVGEDSLPCDDGRTYRQAFECAGYPASILNRVRFLGYISDEMLQESYAKCDIIVVPSRYESFGLVVIEAMQHGKPVVASDCGGISEVIESGRTGFLVPPEDLTSLFERLSALVADRQQRIAIGAMAAAAYKQHFTRAAMAEGVENFFESLVRRIRPTFDNRGESGYVIDGVPADPKTTPSVPRAYP